MSRHYGYRCQAHNMNSTSWFNHGDDELTNLAKVRGIVLDGIDALNNALPYRVNINISGDDYDAPILDFLREHRDCELVVIDEYGNL